MEWHPHALKYPEITGETRQAMKADLKKNGLFTSCKYRMVDGTKQGLDGRNRVALCQELKLEVRWERVWVKDEDVNNYIDSMNLHRRHLSPEQRAEVVAHMSHNRATTREIAKTVGVSPQTVIRDIAKTKQNNGPVVPNGTTPPQKPSEKHESAVAKTVIGKDGKHYKAEKPPKSGKPKFDDRVITEWLARGVRLLGERKAALGGAKQYEECKDILDSFLSSFKRWQMATT